MLYFVHPFLSPGEYKEIDRTLSMWDTSAGWCVFAVLLSFCVSADAVRV